VSGSPDARVPIRIDPTDLLAPARPGSIGVKHRGDWWLVEGGDPDQIGNLSVATELEWHARQWADIRREGVPLPVVPELAGWLRNRLEWACEHYPDIAAFAAKLRDLRGALTAAAGRFDAPPESMNAPCWGCGRLTLIRDSDIERIVCGTPVEHGCWRVMTYSDYSDYAQRLIQENPS
jgi:hypothetical protein